MFVFISHFYYFAKVFYQYEYDFYLNNLNKTSILNLKFKLIPKLKV